MAKEKILIVDDDAKITQSIGDRLKANGYNVLSAENGRTAMTLIQEEYPDLVLLDIQMPEMDGLEVLSQIRRFDENMLVVILTAYGTLERAVSAMKQGAYDFLPKPCDPDHLLHVISKALERRALVDENVFWRREQENRHQLIVSPGSKMQAVLDMAKKVAQTRTTVLIEGESGTGKQMLAYAVHSLSGRRDRPFVHVNCTTLSDPLLESDLFGHEKGAFTGAQRMKRGRVETADGGTLFLDEIGDLSPNLQAKLLRFLEEGAFERVGGLKTLTVDARIVAATNKNLEQEVEKGRFRPDLFYRLNVVRLDIPPLRERPEDILPLATHFLGGFTLAMKKNVGHFHPDTALRLQQHSWPGNVRELENAVERAVVLAAGTEITADLLPVFCPKPPGDTPGVGATLEEALLRFKKQFIQKTLESTGWNQSKAAKILDIQRTYLSRLVKEMDI
ncbi:MAG TPA: sigma-54 dependent transcriptional regulator, partial [bacterium]